MLGFGLLALGLGACDVVPPRAARMSDAYPSGQALAAAMLDALARRDRARLEGLALDEQEFREHVWPDLPAARPERNLPFSYVWGDLHQKSAASLTHTLARHGGRRHELIDVRFARETNYGGYRVHHDASLNVRDESGARTTLRVSGSMIEQAGGWKVFSYVADD